MLKDAGVLKFLVQLRAGQFGTARRRQADFDPATDVELRTYLQVTMLSYQSRIGDRPAGVSHLYVAVAALLSKGELVSC